MSTDSTSIRHHPLPGSRNLRDLGGYPARTPGGERRVRWGCLFRSGHFGDLTSDGKRALAALGVVQVIDFRTEPEREKHPSELSPHPIDVVALPIDPGSALSYQQSIEEQRDVAQGMAAVMEELNRLLVRGHAGAYRRMFELLAGGRGGARVIHCAAGKDRTGVGAALILTALGVERRVVVEDFLLTNRYLDVERDLLRAIEDYAGSHPTFELSREALQPMFEVRPEYLEAAFAVMDEEYGGPERYLADQLGVDGAFRQRLHERYLES